MPRVQGERLAQVDDPTRRTLRRVERREVLADELPGVGGVRRLLEGEAARLGAELAERVKHTIGVTIEVDVVAPGTLERSQGKAQRIDDRR